MKNAIINPFVLQPYVSRELFCDRQEEMNEIISHITNGANVTLISMRRLGKTGLILRTFDELRSLPSKYLTIYADIYATSSLDDFIKTLAESITSQINESGIKKFFSALGGLRPLFSYDPISGQPQVSITYQTENQKQQTLQAIFHYLETLPMKVVVAIDEFQQIREYEGVRMEALLRTHIQNLNNVRFIFCGSRKHLMTDIFSGEKAPFYQSTVNIPLSKLNREVYSAFIIDKFNENGKQIPSELVEYILNWSRIHTFYTQTLCNEIFMRSGTNVTMDDVNRSINHIFTSEADKFYTIRGMLTKGQWRYLQAVASEGTITQPTSGTFLTKYKIGTPAASKRTLSSLIDKELIYEELTPSGKQYSVYNVFLSRWLECLSM